VGARVAITNSVEQTQNSFHLSAEFRASLNRTFRGSEWYGMERNEFCKKMMFDRIDNIKTNKKDFSFHR
jgi:hypothetical protein